MERAPFTQLVYHTKRKYAMGSQKNKQRMCALLFPDMSSAREQFALFCMRMRQIMNEAGKSSGDIPNILKAFYAAVVILKRAEKEGKKSANPEGRSQKRYPYKNLSTPVIHKIK